MSENVLMWPWQKARVQKAKAQKFWKNHEGDTEEIRKGHISCISIENEIVLIGFAITNLIIEILEWKHYFSIKWVQVLKEVLQHHTCYHPNCCSNRKLNSARLAHWRLLSRHFSSFRVSSGGRKRTQRESGTQADWKTAQELCLTLPRLQPEV